ncbi:serine O-acetyltransferase [Candidatus Poribacteria bacterium]|jgi:serine O-acetyltransferase|nr:serine O-acetyltransferase [Candidatus Poribacteria bacterium]MBT5710337.1 serine O-acetyltransferase [Candidatus Poribacteria bacterium]MBT7804758.1 serine O-acetyltransferase [Candidatus Poribacteria bacterium]
MSDDTDANETPASGPRPRAKGGPVGRWLRVIREDVAAALERDPAARHWLEVVLCYPGWHALMVHRVSHWMWQHRAKLPARMLSNWTRFTTGIEIHPAARIGPGLFIDHGMGVVIGETAVVGRNVTLYHGVTLGGRSRERTKRHPTVKNHVVIGAGAEVLGPVTIAEHARIGAGSVVVTDVPPNSVIVGVPGRVTFRDGVRTDDGIDLAHDELPDPVVHAMECLLDRVRVLETELDQIQRRKSREPDEPVPHPYDEL